MMLVNTIPKVQNAPNPYTREDNDNKFVDI